MEYEQLKLENQVCFPLYSAARLLVRSYAPLLKDLDLTYPQYLVMMVLWEYNTLTVNEITDHLLLDTNTVTPLLQRMQKNGLLTRKHDKADRRRVIVSLTEKGRSLQEKAADIPQRLLAEIPSDMVTKMDWHAFKSQLEELMRTLNDKNRCK